MFLQRKLFRFSMFLGRRKTFGVLLVVAWLAWMVAALRWSRAVSRALLPPPPLDHDLSHLRRSTSLQHYLENIQVLVEPSYPCEDKELPIVILVSSAPGHAEQRQAIRSTWGQHQPTYFILGLQGKEIDKDFVDNYMEARMYGDMIIVDMVDHYQNLTLKTALLLKWTLERCPAARRLCKTDDDVLINPWTLAALLTEHADAKLVGYRVNNTKLHRDAYVKWYVPRWLEHRDPVPAYLSGTGYIIHGKYLREIYEAALRTRLLNLEDVYLTGLVAREALGYPLTHDRRLSPYKPWVPVECAYRSLALVHSVRPAEMARAWPAVRRAARGPRGCAFYRDYVEGDWLLY